MLKIRPDQLERLGDDLLSKFKSNLTVFLTDTYPESFPEGNNKDASGFVETGIEKAQTYGIAIESEITEFVERMVTYGEDFDNSGEYEWIEEILNNPDIAGDEKMGHIALVELDESLN